MSGVVGEVFEPRTEHDLGAHDEAGLAALARLLAAVVRPGDTVLLEGDLGAGKTTFARAMIRSLLGDPAAEVPSPTFALVQTYDAARMPVAHADLYRMREASEADELGLAEAAAEGLTLIEWPERAPHLQPADRLEVHLAEAESVDRRAVRLVGIGGWAHRLARFSRLAAFLARTRWVDADPTYFQGDASVRRYIRLAGRSGVPDAILMDWERQPDGPPIRDGLPYSRIAHLAEGVEAFVAVGEALRGMGLSAPAVYGADLESGFLVLEDLGDRVYGRLIADGQPMLTLYREAMLTLLQLARHRPPERLPVPGAADHPLPLYDAGALTIEVELLVDWYWPLVTGRPIDPERRRRFLDLWQPLIATVAGAADGWVLRDFHSPNLIWLPGREGPARVGLIDYQDAMRGSPAYDLASLLQDARLDAPPELEAQLLDEYCAHAAGLLGGFDEREFRRAYAILGAQRTTKILGIFARLSMRDGKHGYLAHIPRIWGYLERSLAHPDLARLAAWYAEALPPAERRRPLRQ